LPLSLRLWYEQVGSVNFMGEHPDWEYEYTDPLVVEAPLDYVYSSYEDWRADAAAEGEEGGFAIDVAPDYLHKADVSGGGPYALAVPNAAVDGILLEEFHETTFVNYLRICFKWAGFRGWERSGPKWARAHRAPPDELARLAADLLPI
jgi:hypothetical protein